MTSFTFVDLSFILRTKVGHCVSLSGHIDFIYGFCIDNVNINFSLITKSIHFGYLSIDFFLQKIIHKQMKINGAV